MKIHVTVEITAVEFHPLNSFEWSILSCLSCFPDKPPSLVEVAERLCVHELRFLAVALETMQACGAVEKKDESEEEMDLSAFRLTKDGESVLRNDGWETKEENKSLQLTLCWPDSNGGGSANFNEPEYSMRFASVPTAQEVEPALSREKLEEELNKGVTAVWRIKSFFVSNVKAPINRQHATLSGRAV